MFIQTGISNWPDLHEAPTSEPLKVLNAGQGNQWKDLQFKKDNLAPIGLSPTLVNDERSSKL